jgi:hypothetical membrane protein
MENREDKALKLSLPIALAGYFVFFLIGLYLQFRDITITNVALGFSLIAVSALIPFYFLTTIFYKNLKEDAAKRKIKFSFNYWFWRDTTLSLAYAIIFGIIGFIIAAVIARAFKDFIYQPYTFAMWPALAMAGWTYFSINMAENFQPEDIVNIVGVYLIGGVTLSAILNPNPQWWEESISYLGMNNYGSAKVLNLSLILSGALLVVMSSFFARRFDILAKKKLITEKVNKFLKYSFILAPIGLACVGIFPYMDEAPRMYIHNFSAFLAFGLFGLVMFLTYWIMPFFSKYYMRVNYLLFLTLAVIFVMNVVGYLTLALTEMMAFGIISVWMILFLRSVDGLMDWKLES